MMGNGLSPTVRLLLTVASTLLALYWAWKQEWTNAGLFVLCTALFVWSYFRHGREY